MTPILPTAATAAALLALAAASGCDEKSTTTTPPPQTAPGGSGASGGAPDPVAGASGPVAPPLPKYWFESDFGKWIGKRWDEIDLMLWLPRPPSGIEQGTRYVVFYGRTCEHCEEMFHKDLAPDGLLAGQVTAVEVPTDDPPTWKMPATECEMLALPRGVDWIITTPLTLRIEDGVIRCAIEGDHKECMGLGG